MSAKDVLNAGDLNMLGAVFRAIGLGDLLAGGGDLRLVRESVAVSSDACTPTYAIKRLLSCKVSGGSSGNGEKLPSLNGDVAVRLIKETLDVASAAAAPTYPILRLLESKTVGTGAAGEKLAGVNGATPGTGAAAPNAGGTSIVFNAETTGTGTVIAVYLTAGATATPNSGGTSVAFLGSEVAGASAVAELLYLTSAPPNDANGNALAALSDTITGIG